MACSSTSPSRAGGTATERARPGRSTRSRYSTGPSGASGRPRTSITCARSTALTGDFVGARDLQRSYAARMLELGDPISAAMGHYLAASMGDMAGRDDVLADINAACELATVTKDVSLLCQLLRLEARVPSVRATNGDEPCSPTQSSNSKHAAASGRHSPRRDLGLIALGRCGSRRCGRPAAACSVGPRPARPIGGRAALARIARLAVEHGDAGQAGARIAALVPSMRRPGAPSSLDDERRSPRAARRYRTRTHRRPRRAIRRSTTKASWELCTAVPAGRGRFQAD